MTASAEALRRGVRLEWLTIGWAAVEAAVAIVAGLQAGSIALAGFGWDSAIEAASGTVLLWRLAARGNTEKKERTSLKTVGVLFLVLAAYVLWESAEALWSRTAPGHSWIGIALAAVSALGMPLLARAKRRVAGQVGSAALTADSRQSALCGYLSLILLAGLALNALLGWWWADPVAGLAMVGIIAKEGIDALRGRTCCDCCHG